MPGGSDGGGSSRSAGAAGLDRARRESAPLAVRRSGSEQHRLVDRPEGCRVGTVREVWREGRLGREEGKRGRGWVLPAAEASDAESKPSVWRGCVEIIFGRGQNRRSPRGPTRGFRARGITRYIQVNYRWLRLEDERLVGTTDKTKQGLRLQGRVAINGWVLWKKSTLRPLLLRSAKQPPAHTHTQTITSQSATDLKKKDRQSSTCPSKGDNNTVWPPV